MKFRHDNKDYTVDDSAKADGYVRLDDNTALRILPDGTVTVSNKAKPKAPLAVLDATATAIEKDDGEALPHEPDPEPEPAPAKPRPFEKLTVSEVIAKLDIATKVREEEKEARRELGARLLLQPKRSFYKMPDGSRVFGKVDRDGSPTITTEKRGQEAAA